MNNLTSIKDRHKLSFITVKNGIVTKVGQPFADMTGYPIEIILNRPVSEVFEILRIGPDRDIQYIDEKAGYFLFTKSLEVRFVSIDIIKDSEEIIYILREKPNTRLEDKFNYLFQLFSHNVTGVSIFSVPDFILLKANQKCFDFFDAPFNTPENTFGRPMLDFLPGWEDSTFREICRNVVATGMSKRIEEFRYDNFARGITYWNITLTPIKEEGRVKYIVINPYDVTENVINRIKIQHQMEDIKLKNKQLEAIFESMYDRISIVDRQGRYLKKSSGMKGSIFEPTDLNMKTVEERVSYYDLEGNPFPKEELCGHKLLEGISIKNQRLRLVLDNFDKYMQFSGVPIFNENNQFEMGVMFNIDISEAVNFQKMALQAEREKNEALEKAIDMKDEFLSLISHEFRTPLSVINTAIQAINYIYGNELPQKVNEFIATIRQNTYRQLRLVNNLLDITRVNAGNIKMKIRNTDIVFLTKAITQSVSQYAGQREIKLTFVSSTAKKIIGIDDEKYERILLNLLSNAIKFSPEGREVTVKLHTSKGSVCIEVRDNGIGIPQDKIDLIFERFGQVDNSFSRQAEGTGIGLSLVKKFAEALGGTISVKSKVDKGSTFTLTLPDQRVLEEYNEEPILDMMDNRLVQTTTVEFSDIYL